MKEAELEFVKHVYTLLLWDAMQLPARIRFLKCQELHSLLRDDTLSKGRVLHLPWALEQTQ